MINKTRPKRELVSLVGNEGSPLRYHVIPADEKHESTGVSCWCKPHVIQVCPECNDDNELKLGCWKCAAKGWIKAWTGDKGIPTIVIHFRKDAEKETPC